MDSHEANNEAIEVLAEVFSEMVATYKVKIKIDSYNNVTIEYADMDEGWCDELRKALRI